MLVLGFLFGSSRAFAQYQHRVVLLEQESSNEAAAEVRTRLRGELTAAGFEVVLLPLPAEGDPAVVSDTAASELHPAAVILVIEKAADDTDPRRIELWLSDRLSRRTFVQSLNVDPDDAGRGYRRLAVQAVELLKARLAELQVTPPDLPPVKPPPPPPKRPPPPPPKKAEPKVGGRITGGAALLQGFEDVDASIAPRLGIGATIPAGSIGRAPFAVDVGATFTGFGTKSEVTTPGGNATVEQGLGTLDLGFRFDRGAVMQPVLVATGGAYSVNVEGTSEGERVGHEDRTWSVFTSVGAGLLIQPAKAFGIELEGQVGRAWAKTIVRIDGQDAAETGSPLLLFSLAAVGIF
jgi:hypothetical protein